MAHSAAHPPEAAAAHNSADDGQEPLWKRACRWCAPVFGLLVLGLLASHAHKIDWAGAWQALLRYPIALLAGVLAVALASHALYGCFDLIGRRHVGHGLPKWRTWAIAVTSYAFNLNLGSLVGGVAMRVRLYARAGLDAAQVAQVVGVSLVTNWLGFGVLAGALFAAGVITPPRQTNLGNETFRLLGWALIALAVAYLAACTALHGRRWQVRGKTVSLPRAPLALAQLLLSMANWALMGAAMYWLLGERVEYGHVLGVLMAASIVGVVTPIPAGLGVLEAVYLALLSGSVRQGALMGAVLAYRALYYVLPLAIALLSLVFLERYAISHPPEQDG
jgi:uncharacterized membrane protein YbhN (UPF0104 family)